MKADMTSTCSMLLIMSNYLITTVGSFTATQLSFMNIKKHTETLTVRQVTTSGKGFAVVETQDESAPKSEKKQSPITITGDDNKILNDELSSLPIAKLKERLLDLLPRMTGKREELEEISLLVNIMEEKFSPVMTLDFLNLAMQGEWQLLFSTNRLGMPNTKLRLRELVQSVEPNNEPNENTGKIDTLTTWDVAEDGINFSHTGTFTIKSTYEIEKYPRLSLSLAEHVIKPRGDIPSDIQGLFGMLYHAIPTEMFDPQGLGMDTTFIDTNVRIVRLAGEKFEGVRNIFIRKDSVEINPGSPAQ
jgi:hypothetical protein